MRTFRKFYESKVLVEAVSDIPSDLKSLIDKHIGMSKFTSAIYDASHKDLNELSMSDQVIKSGKKVSTSDIDKISNNGMYLLVDLGDDGLLLAGKGLWNVVYDNKKRYDSVYVNDRSYNVDSTRNIASLLNSDKYKDAKYWLIDLSKAKSTEDLRNERMEAQKGVIKRYNDGWYTTDKSGYRVDRHKYEKMLQELKMKGNDYVKQLSDLSSRFFKALTKIDQNKYSYIIRDTIEKIKDATQQSVNSFRDASEVKESIRKAEDYVKKVESLA